MGSPRVPSMVYSSLISLFLLPLSVLCNQEGQGNHAGICRAGRAGGKEASWLVLAESCFRADFNYQIFTNAFLRHGSPHLGFFSFSCRNAGRCFGDLCGQSLTHTHVLWPECLFDVLHPEAVFPSSSICNRGVLPHLPTSILIGRQSSFWGT